MLWTAAVTRSDSAIHTAETKSCLEVSLKHFDECMTTRMSEEFWAFSNTAWAKCERHASPVTQDKKLTLTPSKTTGMMLLGSNYNRRHKEACKSQKGRCRFGMPAGLWPRPTCPVSLFLAQQKVGKDKYKDVVDCRLECKRSDMPLHTRVQLHMRDTTRPGRHWQEWAYDH